MGAENQTSNYEQMKHQMAGAFLKCSQDRMVQNFGLKQDELYLYVHFVGREYRINRLTGKVSWSDDLFASEEAAGYNETMTIYDVLSRPGQGCHLAKEWINIESLSPIQGGFLKRGNSLFLGFEQYFDGKSALLSRACEALQGRKAGKGDAAYEIDLFAFLSILLRFWESDEEFPASLQILVDKNVLNYMHYETLMFAITHVLEVLKGKSIEGIQGL